MPPRNQNNNPNRNPYEKGSGYDFRNRQQQLNQEFEALKIKEIDDLEEILEKQAEVFEKEKEWLETMVGEVRDRHQDNRIPRDMPLDFEMEEPAQDTKEAMTNTICANNERIDKMVRVRHKLREVFPFLKNITLTGEAPDADTADEGRGRDADRGRPERGARVEDKKRANEAMEAVAHWYEEEARKIDKGETPADVPQFIQEQEGNDEYKNLADPRKVAKVELARQNWIRAKDKYQPKENVDKAVKKLDLALVWLNEFKTKANDSNVDLAELQRWQAEMAGHPNAVFQAREFIRERDLAQVDKVKEKNNPMEELVKEIEKKIKERAKEKLIEEIKKSLEKLKDFLIEVGKTPDDSKPELDTFEKRAEEWHRLNQEMGNLLGQAAGNDDVQREARAELREIAELRDKKIPEALVAAGLRGARAGILKAEDELNGIKTLDDLLNRIAAYKGKVEGKDFRLPPHELISDEEIGEWLNDLTSKAQQENAAVLQYLQFHLPEALRPTFRNNFENLEKELEVFQRLIEKKKKELIEAKHRARVREAVTSKAVQKGTAKRAGMFPHAEQAEAGRIDIDELKEKEIWGQVINILLREQTFLGREKGGQESRVAQSEAGIIRELQRQFGPDSPFHFTDAQCEDLFYAAKSWVMERVSLAAMGEQRQAMPEAAEQGGVEAKAVTEPRPAGRWKKIALKALGWTGLGVGAVAAAPALGFSALAGLGAVGALRVIDNIRHHVCEQRRFNQEKNRLRSDQEFQEALKAHLSFTVANLRENNLRAGAAGLGYQNYFQNIRQHLAHENERREKPLSDAELDKTAAAFAVFYQTDDQIERERAGVELNRSANARHWWEYIDVALGQAVRGGTVGKGWQISNPSRRLFSGSAWLGASFGLMACRDVVPGLKHALRAYAGWKIGGAAVDWWAGKRAPENESEQQLTELEAMVPHLPEMKVSQLGEQIQRLSDCRAVLNAISNPVEYARQKERLKEVLMAVLAEKILKEESALELDTQEKVAEKGADIAGEAGRFYATARVAQVEQEERVGKYRLYGRLLGAAGMVAAGYWLEEGLRALRDWWQSRPSGPAPAPEPTNAKMREPEEVLPQRPRAGAAGLEAMPPVEPHPVGPMQVMEDAVVHKGEGVEHALRRQIEADPAKWGYTGKGSIHRFAGHEAHRIANELGYVKGSAEVRVRLIDKVAYILDKDSSGRAVVDEVRVHKMSDDSFMPDQPIAGGTSSQLDKEYEYGYHKPSGPKVLDWDKETTPVSPGATTHVHEPSVESAKFAIHGGLEKFPAGDHDYYLAHYGHGNTAGTLVFDDVGNRVGYVDHGQVFLTEQPQGGWPTGSPEHLDLHAGTVAAVAAAETPADVSVGEAADAGVAEPDAITKQFEEIKAQAESGHGAVTIEESSGSDAVQPAAGAGATEGAVPTAEEARDLLTGQYIDSSSALNTQEHMQALKDALNHEVTHSLRLNGVNYKLVSGHVNFDIAGQRGIVGGSNMDILRDFHDHFKNSDPKKSDIDELITNLKQKK